MANETQLCPDDKHEWSVSVDVQNSSRGGELRMQMRIESVSCKRCGTKLGHRFPDNPMPEDVLPLYPLPPLIEDTRPVRPVQPTQAIPRVPDVAPRSVNVQPPPLFQNPFSMGKHSPDGDRRPNIFGSCQQ